MTVKTGQSWAGTFVTKDATGALATPSVGPVGTLYVNGVANAATVTITGSNPYKWAVTLPTLTAGQRVDMYITATIATIATAGIVASAQADTALNSDIALKTDLLDVSDITVVATVDGSTITILRGDTWDDAHLLNLCDLTDYVSIDFIVKESKAHTDDDAIIHIRKNASGTGDGLLRFNKAAYATATDGAITIEDIPTGDITPTLKATATKDLVPGSYIYDIQVITATSVKTRTSGVLKVMSDVTRAIA